MPINETQLNTWGKQGSITQSQSTYSTIRQTLENRTTAYSGKNYKIYLQGSYGNDTNIYADSDVDVIIQLNETYYDDFSNLSDAEKILYSASTTAGTYSFEQFKSDVISQLKTQYSSSVKPGNKAIFIEGSGSRRDADVVAATQFRRYSKFKNLHDQNYVEGICFWTTNGTQIINYPRQHSENCTRKHQATANWFKPTVRMFKNMRNTMIASGYLAEGVAPSYFIEGMLYNVPNLNFGKSYVDTFVSAINWITKSDRAKLLCANEQYYLIHEDSPVTWRAEKLQTFLDSTVKFWNEF